MEICQHGFLRRSCSICDLEEDNEQLKESLKVCMEAIRKNLVYAQVKDEVVLYEAYKKAEKTLSEC